MGILVKYKQLQIDHTDLEVSIYALCFVVF